MRISDWSSDVCSSDLVEVDVQRQAAQPGRQQRAEHAKRNDEKHRQRYPPVFIKRRQQQEHDQKRKPHQHRRLSGRLLFLIRLEKHTSELQPLMRISYAVFFLKKKLSLLHNTRPLHNPEHRTQLITST